MTRFSIVLFAAALLLVVGRLFTGIVYLADGPPTYFVVKRTPSLVIAKTLPKDERVRDNYFVLGEEEIQLIQQPAYEFLMTWAFPLAVGLLVTGFLLARSRS